MRHALPKISIVTPSYNQGAFIEQTILSVLEQHYPNLEFIIIDGKSTDNTVEILKKYQKHLTYWVSEKDAGQSNAINKGLIKCTGDVFNWLNSDDYLEPNALLAIGEIFKEDRVGLLAGKCRKFGNGAPDKIVPELHVSCDINHKIFQMEYIQPSTFIRMTAIKEMGMLNEQLCYCMDYEWMIRYVLSQGLDGVVEVDTVFTHARLHDSSKTNLQIPQFYTEIISIYYYLANAMNLDSGLLKKYESFSGFKKLNCSWNIHQDFNKAMLEKELDQYITPFIQDPSYIFRRAADYYASFKQYKSTSRISLKAIRTNPFNVLNYKYFLRSIVSQQNL